jgi:hypothetical protein
MNDDLGTFNLSNIPDSFNPMKKQPGVVGNYKTKILGEPIGVIMAKLDKQTLDALWKDVSVMQENIIKDNTSEYHSVNEQLAGHIKHEYASTPEMRELLLPIVSSMANRHFMEFPYQLRILKKFYPTLPEQWKGSLDYSLRASWVNFQKKTEYNPIHNHGGLMSFVIWLKVPFKHEDERSYYPDTTVKNTAGFTFVINGEDGVAHEPILVDEQFEGQIAVFPSNLSHSVYPFYTSDEYRISISGNLYPEPITIDENLNKQWNETNYGE